MTTAYIAYLIDMKTEVFLSPYKNLQLPKIIMEY